MNSINLIPLLVVVVSATLIVSVAIWTSFTSMVEENNQESADGTVDLNVILGATSDEKGIEDIQLEANSHNLFHENSEGFAVYRLPAIVYHQQTFLVFCEGRKGTADSSLSKIVMKRGYLNGTKVNWDKTLTVVASINETRLANPTPVVDKVTNTIFVVYNVLPAHVKEDTFLAQDHYNQSILIIKSQDLGVTWSEPQNITQETLGQIQPVPVFYSPGPGHALQMKSGRLVIQGNFYYREINATHKTFKSNTTDHSVVFISDNHGESWRPGGFVPYAEDNKGDAIYTSEATIVELANNTLCINSRTLSKGQPRAQAFSSDGGDIFGNPVLVEKLVEPENIGVTSGCEASILGFPAPKSSTKYRQIQASASENVEEQPWVIFSNPANSIIRILMSIRLSKDGCQTWSDPWTIWDLASGYSDLVQYEDTTKDDQGPLFGIVYENGYVDTISTVTFMTFTLDDLHNGIKATELRQKQQEVS